MREVCETSQIHLLGNAAHLLHTSAVIPAPLAYIKVAAVKKLVVGSRDRVGGFVASLAFRRRSCGRSSALSARSPPLVGFHLARAARRRVWAGVLNWMPALERGHFTLNKSECSKQALHRSNGSAWNNGRGPASASVGLTEAGNDQEGRMGAEVWPGER